MCHLKGPADVTQRNAFAATGTVDWETRHRPDQTRPDQNRPAAAAGAVLLRAADADTANSARGIHAAVQGRKGETDREPRLAALPPAGVPLSWERTVR